MDARRLCHISDLPNNLHFLPIEIKHLLPIHHPSFADNLTTIIANQARLLNWTVYPDLTLSLANSVNHVCPPHYSVMSGGWCEDIDGQPHHLKASLELAAVVLNYIHSLIIAPPAEEELTIGQSIIRTEHIGFQPIPVPFYVPITLAYNIFKKKDKEQKGRFIFLVGQHRVSELRLYSVLSAVRHWNLHRLKASTCSKVTPIRVHKQLEHLLTILRGFLQLEEVDYQAKKRQLQLLVGWIKEGELPKEAPREGIEADQQVVLSRFQLTYRSKLQQKDIDNFGSYFIRHILTILPLQQSCSFVGRSCYYPNLNQFVLIWMTTFKRYANYLVDPDALGYAVVQAAAFLRQKSVQAIKDNSNNIADQMLRSSLKVLSRYAPGQQKNRIKEWSIYSQNSQVRQKSNSIRQSVIEERYKALDFDRMSMISKISYKNPRSEGGRDARTRMQAEFQSLSFPLAAHRDREYAELLVRVEAWQNVYGKMTPWGQLKNAIHRNCERVRSRYAQSRLSVDEQRLLLALVAVRHYVEVEQFLMMLKNHTEQREALFQVLFQRSAGGFLMDLGVKLAKDSAMSIYEVYITRQCSVERASLLMLFMKRLVGLFAPSAQVPPYLGERVSVPVLVWLLQTQEIRGQKYLQVAGGVLGEIFAQNKALCILSPLLHAMHKTLVGDHHEQLVMGLLAGLAYEAAYFTYDFGQISNSPYRKQQDLRQKKLLEVLRIGGFGGLGYEIKRTLGNLILRNAEYRLPSARLFEQIVIGRPLQIARFVQTLLRSPIIQHLSEVVQYFQGLQRTANSITRPIAHAFLVSQAAEFKWQVSPPAVPSGLKSESGIFRQLLEYNPQIKIAGRSLSEVLRERGVEQEMLEKRWNTEVVVQKEVGFGLQEMYEYIVMVGRLKEKYEGYDGLQEDEKIYLREIVHKMLGRKNELIEYMQLAALVKQFDQDEAAAIF